MLYSGVCLGVVFCCGVGYYVNWTSRIFQNNSILSDNSIVLLSDVIPYRVYVKDCITLICICFWWCNGGGSFRVLQICLVLISLHYGVKVCNVDEIRLALTNLRRHLTCTGTLNNVNLKLG